MALLAATLACFLGVLGIAGSASAHGAEGEMTVITAEPAGAFEVRLQIGLLYANDTELATEATVTVTGVGPDGNTLRPTALPREEGAKYGTTLTGLANGPWTFTIVSTGPAATATASVEVPVDQQSSTTTPSPTTTAAPATTVAPDTTTTTSAPVVSGDDAGSSESNPAVIAAIAIATIAVVGGLFLFLRSRRSGPDGSTGGR